MFRILDNDHDGRIDGLEFVGSLVLVCRASFEEKVKLLFEAFDLSAWGGPGQIFPRGRKLTTSPRRQPRYVEVAHVDVVDGVAC